MFIQNRLNNLFEDIKTLIAERDDLCAISGVGRDGEAEQGYGLDYYHVNNPDYSDPLTQKLHDARHIYAYYPIYKQMEQDMISCLGDKSSYRVLSIGCGSGIDLRAFDSLLPGDVPVEFTGVDPIDWEGRPEDAGNRTYAWNTATAADFFKEQEKLPYDMILFPTSIPELGDEDMEAMAKAIREKKLPERFTLGVTTRATGIDQDKYDQLVKTIADAGYHCVQKKDFHVDEKVPYFKLDPTYNYEPYNMINYLNTLSTQCHCVNEGHGYCMFRDECEKILNKAPMLKTGILDYHVCCFERQPADGKDGQP